MSYEELLTYFKGINKQEAEKVLQFPFLKLIDLNKFIQSYEGVYFRKLQEIKAFNQNEYNVKNRIKKHIANDEEMKVKKRQLLFLHDKFEEIKNGVND
jgi:hypothetical protein